MGAKPRIIFASSLAPLGVISPLVLLALITIFFDTHGPGGNSPVDDAPLRAAGIVLLGIVPLTYPILFALMCILGYSFQHLGLLTRKNLFFASFMASIPIAFILGWQSPYGLNDQLIGLGIFFILAVTSLSFGTFCWWYLATLGINNNDA